LRFPLPVFEAAYGGNSLFGPWLASTGSMPMGIQDDPVPSGWQCNLELSRGNKILDDFGCALRHGFYTRLPMIRRCFAIISAFPNGDRNALG